MVRRVTFDWAGTVGDMRWTCNGRTGHPELPFARTEAWR